MTNVYQMFISRAVRYWGKGETVLVRRPNNLTSRITGGAASPTLKTSLSGGESSFVLTGNLEGSVPIGLAITMDGQEYATTAAAEADGAGDMTVSVTPVVPGSVVATMPATLGAYAEFTFQKVRSKMSDTDISRAGDPISAQARRIHLAKDTAPTTPEVEDFVSVDGEMLRIVRVSPIGPLTEVAGWTIFAGDAALLREQA